MIEYHHNDSTTSKVKKKITLTVQGIIIGALLLSTMVLVLPSGVSTSLPTTAFATIGGGVICDGETATIVGTTSRSDTIVGTSGRDVIAALSGHDIVDGGGGDDLICGGSGNDVISGGDGNDRIIGESGNDQLNGNSGTDQLVGNSGNDRADGGAGNDTCNAETEISCDEPADTTAPVLTVPEDIEVEATDAEGAVVNFEVSAEDDVDGPVEVTCDSNSGDTFEIGETVVTCSAEDAAGNTATETFTVTVTPLPDTTAPVITVPEDITVVDTNGDGSEVVTFEVTAEDDVDGPVEVTCDSNSGDTFQIGTTTVTCTATDAAGNTGTASFTVTVNPPPDTTAPTLDVPDDMRVFAPSTAPVVVTWEVTAQDNVDGTATLHEDNTLTQDNVGGDITISCSPRSGTAFSVGVNSHGVLCTATDEAGNTATAGFRITTSL